ncbi:hypothetical protein Tco_1116396 [Tanacetum coccineum]
MENENPMRTLGDYFRPSHKGYQNTIELPDGNNVVPLRSGTIRLVQNECSFHELRSEDPNQHLKDFLKPVDLLDLDVANKERTGLQNLALYDNESWNDPKDFAKPVKEISLPQDVPSTSDRRLIELENYVQRFMEAHLAPKSPVQVSKIASSCEIYSGPHDTQYCMENPEQDFKRLSSLGTQLKQQQDDVINKINTLWKVVFEKINNAPAHDNAGDFMARVNAVSIYHPESEAPLRKRIKSLSKLLSPKYQSQSSLGEQNRSSSSSPKRVYFVNTITVIRKDDEFREAGTIESDAVEDNGRDTIVEESEEETEEEEEDDPKYFDTFPTIEELVEDTTSVIDHYLGGMVLGKPFVKETELVHIKEEGTIMFEKGNEKIIFKMPYKMERFKHIVFEEIKTDCIPPFFIEGNDDDHEKTHYSDSLNLEPAYRRDESLTKAIQCLIKMKSRKDEGGVT